MPLAREPPEEYQPQVLLSYDTARFPFVESVRALLGEDADEDLATLHDTPRGREILTCFHKGGGGDKHLLNLGPRGNPWNRGYHSAAQTRPKEHAVFKDLYHDFLRHYVLPHLSTERIAFQASPTFRCHLPGCGAPGRPHRDEDYGHPRCEVNFWMAMTPVSGSNGLYAETRRGSKDFKAFELGYGELVRFYGNQVWHYNTGNETDVTRVSLDFRVIRFEDWTDASFCYFHLGGYYDVMDRNSGLLDRSSEEFKQLQKDFGGPPSRDWLKTARVDCKKAEAASAAKQAAEDAEAAAEKEKKGLAEKRSKLPCHAFAKGKCRFGDSCQYSHQESAAPAHTDAAAADAGAADAAAEAPAAPESAADKASPAARGALGAPAPFAGSSRLLAASIVLVAGAALLMRLRSAGCRAHR